MGVYGRITKTSRMTWLDEELGLKNPAWQARYGLELAQLAYDFKRSPGSAPAGLTSPSRWTGGTTGMHTVEKEGDWRQIMLNGFLPKLAKRLTVLSNPITQIRGLKDEALLYDTGKAVTMIKPLPDRRFAVAIGFTGTGKRPQDWVSNIRFGHPNRLHIGFEYLAELYEHNAEDITFPAAAGMLGLETLTLGDVLAECRREDSRFTLLVAGHSQGAAVLQVYAAFRRAYCPAICWA